MIEEELPENWSLSTIGDVVTNAKNGGTPKRSNSSYWEGEIEWLSSGEIFGKEVHTAEESITQKGLEESSAKMFPENSVLVAMYGKTRGQSTILRDEMSGNQAICCLEVDQTKIAPEYLLHYLKNIKQRLKDAGRGGGQTNINQSVILRQQIPVPPLDEQERIVEAVEERLERVERLEKSIQSVRQLSAEYESSIMAYIFSDLDFNSKESAKNLPEAEDIPNSWELTTLGDMAYFQNGNGFSKSQWEEEGKPIIRIQNLTGTGDSYNYFSGEVHDRYAVENGDILFSWSGTIDAFRWTGGDAWLNQHIYRVDVEDGVEEKYLFYLLKRCANILEKRKVGGTLQHIRKGDVTGLQVPLPPKKEQCKIVERLESIDFSTLEKGVTDTNELLTEYRESILSRAFQDTPEADL